MLALLTVVAETVPLVLRTVRISMFPTMTSSLPVASASAMVAESIGPETPVKFTVKAPPAAELWIPTKVPRATPENAAETLAPLIHSSVKPVVPAALNSAPAPAVM